MNWDSHHNKMGYIVSVQVAAINEVPDRLFKRHGRWQSETAKDGYVENFLKAR